MQAILTAVIPVVIIGILCAAMLVVASKLMAFKEDERFPKVRECLPGANCGACGYAGCDGYAKALVDDSSVPANLCVPGGEGVARELSDALGVEFAEVEAKAAVVHCLGDCAEACPQDAIYISKGIAMVYPPECIGCGICVRTCPNSLISLHKTTSTTVVSCSNRDKGAATRKACSNGCIGCKKCEKACQFDAIKVKNNLAEIDYEKCTSCGECVKVCTTGCIKIYKLAE